MRGHVGGQTSFRTAKDAGVTFKLSKKERKYLARVMRETRALDRAADAARARDMRPRLVKT